MKDNYYSIAVRISWITFVVSFAIFAVKITIGIFSNSVAIFSDAAHSIGDLLTTGVVLFSLYFSRKPPDKKHPFGHGRGEYVAGMILAILLGLVGLNFLKSAVERIFNPQSVIISWFFVCNNKDKLTSSNSSLIFLQSKILNTSCRGSYVIDL